MFIIKAYSHLCSTNNSFLVCHSTPPQLGISLGWDLPTWPSHHGSVHHILPLQGIFWGLRCYRSSDWLFELQMQIVFVLFCFPWVFVPAKLVHSNIWRQTREVLQIQSSQIQTEEQFSYVWIHHAINSSHVQTNVVASQQHGIVDDTQVVAVILSHQFVSCPSFGELLAGTTGFSSWVWGALRHCVDRKSIPSGLWAFLPALGNQCFQKTPSIAFLECGQCWNASN